MTSEVIITGTKHNVKCKDCGRMWGVYLNQFGNLPDGWDICLHCASRNKNVTKENVENDKQREEALQQMAV